MTAHFDPLEYAQQLETAGVPKAQAEVHARTLGHVIDDCVAVPADLASMKRELTHLISEVTARWRAVIQELEARLNSKLEIMEARLTSRIDELKAELRFNRWVSGVTLAFVVAIFAQSMRL